MRIDKDTSTFVVDDRHRYPVTRITMNDLDPDTLGMPYFERKCLMTFESGATLSIIYGHATWSVNRDAWLDGYPFDEDPACVEVWASWEEDPRGYVDSEGLLMLIAQANIQPSEHPTQGATP